MATHPEQVNSLRKSFDKAVADYVTAFLKQMGWDEYYGGWVAGDCTGIYTYGDEYFVNLSDIIFCVDNAVSEKELVKWHDYCTWASDFGQSIPSLSAWVRGCPRLSCKEMERLDKLRRDFNDVCKEMKEKY